MITILVLFHSNTFRNSKHFYLFYVCRELKEEYADKGYMPQSLFASLFDRGVHIVTGIRTNMKNRLMDVYDKIMLRKRSIIETQRYAQERGADYSYPPQKCLKLYCQPFGRNGCLCFLRYKTFYQYGVWDGGRSRGEVAHTFLKQTCVKQWNFDLKLDRKNRCVL